MQSAETNGAQSLDRALDLLFAIVRDDGQSTIGKVAAEIAMPVSTAHRVVARFEARGLLIRRSRGHYCAGPAAAAFDAERYLADIARARLQRFARSTGRTGHLGILRADMVTYLVKETPPHIQLFTRERMQLEAYCSAIGKVLLANLPADDLKTYLAADKLIALTDRTITDPTTLRSHLAEVKRLGYATDDGEIADGLFCLAVPLRAANGEVVAALSCAGDQRAPKTSADALLQQLRTISQAIEAELHALSSIESRAYPMIGSCNSRELWEQT